MDQFGSALLQLLQQHASRIVAWCVLPNHYHALVEVTNVLKLLQELGRFHGRTSHLWNGERKQPFFGLTVVSCEKGDIRQTPDGLKIYGETEQREIQLPAAHRGREAEVEELYNAVVHKRPVFHDGRWGAATLEACLAILESAAQRKEIFLSHQVPSPE